MHIKLPECYIVRNSSYNKLSEIRLMIFEFIDNVVIKSVLMWPLNFCYISTPSSLVLNKIRYLFHRFYVLFLFATVYKLSNQPGSIGKKKVLIDLVLLLRLFA